MSLDDKPLAWLHGEIKTPPLGGNARLLAGFLLRQLQRGETLSMPHSRPLKTISGGVCELRIPDDHRDWRVIYRVDEDAIVIVEVFEKRTQKTPKKVIEACRRRLATYDLLKRERA